MAKRDIRALASEEFFEFVMGRLGAGVMKTPSPEAAALLRSFLPDFMASDNAQENVSQIVFGVVDAVFNIGSVNRNGLQKFGEEAFQELYRRRDEVPGGHEAQKRHIQAVFNRHAHHLEKLKPGETQGRNFWDTLSEQPEGFQTDFWAWWCTLTDNSELDLLREQGSHIAASSSRIRMIIRMPDDHKLPELKSYFKTAPSLAKKEDGPVEKLLKSIGGSASGFGPDGKHTKGFQKDVDESAERMQEDIDLYRKIGF